MPGQQKFSTAKTGKISGVVHDDRPMPHDPDAEAAVIGAMILEPAPLIEEAVTILGSSSVSAENTARDKKTPVFYNPRNQRIYNILCELHDNQSTIDLITLCNALAKQNQLEFIGGESYLMELMSGIATTANFESWCRIVRDFAILRTLIYMCENIKDRCYSPDESVSGLLDKLEKDVLMASQMGNPSDIVELKHVIKNEENEDEGALNYLLQMMNKDERTVGLSTGFSELDKLIIGLKPGEMFVLAARPSIGKTSFALNMMRNIALRATSAVPVGFFSLEMTAKQLAVRLICTESGYSEKDFYDGNVTNVPKITAAAKKLAKAPIYIDPTSGLKIRELRSKARRLHAMHQVKVIFIDYLQLMKAETRSDNRQEEVAAISLGIKSLAKELNIPIVVLAQLNREAEKTGGEPKLSHLRESGAIEQDADIVAFLHRERDTQKDSSHEFLEKGIEAKLIIEKNRNGRTGIVDLLFFPKLMRFTSKSRIPDEAVPR